MVLIFVGDWIVERYEHLTWASNGSTKAVLKANGSGFVRDWPATGKRYEHLTAFGQRVKFSHFGAAGW